MPYLFPVYPLGADTPGATLVAGAAEAFPYDPAPEAGAAHWLLGVDEASSETAYGGSNTLTAQAGGLQTYGENFVTLPEYGSAMASNIPDSQVGSYYGVIKYAPVVLKNTILVGNISGASQGSGLWLTPSGQLCTVLRGPGSVVQINHGVPSGVQAGDWIFVGLSRWVEGGVSRTRTICGNQLFEGTTWDAAQSVSGVNTLGIGNCWSGTTGYTPAPLDAAEFIVKQAADSAAVMRGVYRRSKVRMSARGITLG